MLAPRPLPGVYRRFGVKCNTRFNPTVNGDLHVGHLYVALVNEHEAHASGGKFGVRFDDSKPCTMEWANSVPDVIVAGRDRQLADLEQFMTVDYTVSELENNWRLCQMPKRLSEDWMISTPHPYPFVVGRRAPKRPGGDPAAGEHYPYVPGWTAEKVWHDAHEGINWLIRGDDLLDEFSLYCYFADLIGVPTVKHTYLPRLQPKGGRWDTVSKTEGGNSIRTYLKHYGKDGIMEKLRTACLKDPDGDFGVDNIKPEPRI